MRVGSIIQNGRSWNIQLTIEDGDDKRLAEFAARHKIKVDATWALHKLMLIALEDLHKGQNEPI